MTLDEAINLYERQTEELYKAIPCDGCPFDKCKEEHRQLAEWLRELKHRRSYENGCQYCKYKFRSDEDEPCIICSHNYTDKFKDDGTREVNVDDRDSN